MSVDARSAQNSRFKIGWVILLIVAAVMTVMHFSLIFVLNQPTLFIGFTAFTLYALLVLSIPFRRHEKWAWYATWVLPVGLALPAANDPDIAAFYYAVAAVCVLGLLVTMRDFFLKSEPSGA